MVRTLFIAALAAWMVLALLPAGAGAHRFNAATTAGITSGGPDGAEGTVSSRQPACERNRLVELFRVDDIGAGQDQSFGTDRTDRSGNWSIDASLFAGDYYVTVAKSTKAGVAKKKKKKKKHKHGCRSAESVRMRL